MGTVMMTRKDEVIGNGSFDSIAWAFEVHVGEPDDKRINSAVLYGNEDAPEMIDFYKEPELLITSKCVRRWIPARREPRTVLP